MTIKVDLGAVNGTFCDCGLCLSKRVDDVILRDFRAVGRDIQISIHYRGGCVRRVVPPATLRDAYKLARQLARTARRQLYVKRAGVPGCYLSAATE